jgi:adenine-specific DNA-methyltransferase
MPTTEQLRKKLLNKLKELFQLDQPDLDFGFYRIMHAKAKQIEEFVDRDLLSIIASAFGQVDGIRQAEAQDALDKAVLTATDFGAPDPYATEPVKKAKTALDALKEAGSSESDVYDHLYRFFERYYDDGDFISRRYYARETSDKAAPFAIPYNGEEVKLHWANADQYYIKTAEYFTNFTFDLTQAAEIRALDVINREAVGVTGESFKVHFKIVDASEGEHGNIKASDNSKRFFVLFEADPVGLNEAGELEIRFEYKNLPGGKNEVESDLADQLKTIYGAKNKGDLPNLATTFSVMSALHDLGKSNAGFQAYAKALALKVPTDAVPERPLLAKYIGQYTARNTCDYFIHKDLGGFLKRELDFYIKNEVMRLDDIENAEAPAVEGYLAKIKVIRKIASKLIEFLAQLEDFQKKLWLKKKFVTETNYCITLDRVPDSLYPQIAANEAQREEWVKLFAIDEIMASEGDLGGGSVVGYSVPLTLEFLKANDKLVLDTRFFDESFKGALLNGIEDFDEQCDGLLVHSENFQALNMLQERFREQVKCVYIDPPYNTGGDGFAYKDAYQHSSWASMMIDRLDNSRDLISHGGYTCITTDYVESSLIRNLGEISFGKGSFLADVAWEKRYTRSNNAKKFYSLKDTITFFSRSQNISEFKEARTEKSAENYTNPDNDERGPWISSSYVNPATKEQRKNLAYKLENPFTKEQIEHPTHAWKYDSDTHKTHIKENRLFWGLDGGYEYPRLKTFLSEAKQTMVPVDLWRYDEVGTTDMGGDQVKQLFGFEAFSNPKPTTVVQKCAEFNPPNSRALILDYFAGSGTTGHAAVNLNRIDNGDRKFILVEMGDHFDTILKPRIAKVVYSTDWKDGKPISRNTGISQCFKYIRLESYEDTLNNLRFVEDNTRDRVMAQNPSLREDYMLHYQLDVETRGSASLLNIEQFANPTGYTLTVKKPGTDESSPRAVDLLETFNYLIGLRLEHLMAPQTFGAKFKRIPDPELPTDQHTKLVLDGALKPEASGAWTFRLVKGWVPANPAHPNNGQQERVLIVWRNLTGDLEQDNAVLDALFEKLRINPRDFEHDTIYVNGSNNLPNLKRDDESWKVRLIEEEFHKRMWAAEGGA